VEQEKPTVAGVSPSNHALNAKRDIESD